MWKHFESREAAIADLTAHGFKSVAEGSAAFFKAGFAAAIHPKRNGFVIVSYVEA